MLCTVHVLTVAWNAEAGTTARPQLGSLYPRQCELPGTWRCVQQTHVPAGEVNDFERVPARSWRS